MRALLVLLLFVVSAVSSAADPDPYILDRENSVVAFRVPASGTGGINGTMPIASADMALDFDRPSSSRVQVVLQASGASASFPFATEAMRGPGILNTAVHPTISFVSRRFDAEGDSARVTGDVTIRGITRPLVLTAKIFRPVGTEQGQRDRLQVVMTGGVSRAEFGATGFPDLVGDRVDLEIRARINRAP